MAGFEQKLAHLVGPGHLAYLLAYPWLTCKNENGPFMTQGT